MAGADSSAAHPHYLRHFNSRHHPGFLSCTVRAKTLRVSAQLASAERETDTCLQNSREKQKDAEE